MRLRGEEAAGRSVPHQALMVLVTGTRASVTMDACGVTRLLVPGFLVGVGASSVTGSDLIGWAAAVLAVTVLLASRRTRGIGAACALARPDAALHPDAHPIQPTTDASPST